MRLQKKNSYIFLSIVMTFTALTLATKPAKAWIFENHWGNGVEIWCQDCSNLYYFWHKNVQLRAVIPCDGAQNGCSGEGPKQEPYLIMKVPNDTLFCRDIQIGQVPLHGRIKVFYGQALVYEKETDQSTTDIRNLNKPGVLCDKK